MKILPANLKNILLKKFEKKIYACIVVRVCQEGWMFWINYRISTDPPINNRPDRSVRIFQAQRSISEFVRQQDDDVTANNATENLFDDHAVTAEYEEDMPRDSDSDSDEYAETEVW